MKAPVKTPAKKPVRASIDPIKAAAAENLVPVTPVRTWDLDEMMAEINRLRAEHREFIETHSSRPSWKDDIVRRKGIIEGLNMWDDFLRKG